jgi:hypothetical protein
MYIENSASDPFSRSELTSPSIIVPASPPNERPRIDERQTPAPPATNPVDVITISNPQPGVTPTPTPVGGTAPVSPLPTVVDPPVSGTTPQPLGNTPRSLLISADNARAVRRQVSKELRQLRIALRKEIKQQFGDQIANDPALKAKLRELFNEFHGNVRQSFLESGGNGRQSREFDGDTLLIGIDDAFQTLRSGLNEALATASPSANPAQGTEPASDSEPARLAPLVTTFESRYAGIETYLTRQALGTITGQVTAASRRSMLSVIPSSLGMNLRA